MSIKDELNYVKNELSADEKVLESAFRLESFLKKHKTTLSVLIGTLIAAAIAYNGYRAYRASRLEAANKALATLQADPSDAAARETLKANAPALYEHFALLEAARKKDAAALKALENSRRAVVADMSRYSAGALEKRPEQSRLYRDLVLLEKAYAALQQGDKKAARETLALIDARSPAASVAALLRHATIGAK